MMPSQPFAYEVGHIAWLVLVLGIAIGLKALASIVRTWIEQTSRTRRLYMALEGSSPNQRSEIILACSELEGKSAGEQDGEVADEAIRALAQPRLLVPISQGKRGRKH